MQFLMGLSDNFKPVRGQILLMKPLPSIEDAYCVIQQEERPMTMSSYTSMEDNTVAFAVNNNIPRKNWNSQNQGNQVWNSNNKKDLWCEHCHITGHIQAKCFKLHGFPPNWKPKGKRNVSGHPRSHSNNVGFTGSLNQPTIAHNSIPEGISGINHSGVHSSQTLINSADISPPQPPQLTPDQIQQHLTF
ncbi:hypothetical protein BUALT_Bualt02G0027700 [Buddleja alternifolia]|uniref:Uncharacterized protein n=1 Tax=Buddleja alternifolia TaxID=168488 RepID=A0AAV6XWT4_9LAMI|nr:hypothetical protein BUALT_Bualt02G0027700 [Buddleja alternifolia]